MLEQLGLCDAALSVTILAISDQGRTSQLPLLLNRHLAPYCAMDAHLLRRSSSGRRQLCDGHPVEKLEGHMDCATSIHRDWWY